MGDSQDVTKGEIGSFFPYPELDPSDVAESKRKSPTWPPRSWSLLNSGRAALQQVLDSHGVGHPQGVLWLPSYYCSEVTRYVQRNTPIRVYPCNPTDQSLPSDIPPDDLLLIVSYFGAEPPAHSLDPSQVVLDTTHDPLAPWIDDYRAGWVIGSLRKTLPLPEGGFAHSSRSTSPSLAEPRPSDESRQVAQQGAVAMITKARWLAGDPSTDKDEWYRELQQHEDAFDRLDPASLLPENEQLLRSLPVKSWRQVRLSNLAFLREHLPPLRWAVQLPATYGLVLVCISQEVADTVRGKLVSQGVYPARLWPQPEGSREPDTDLANRILVIHTDHRYTRTQIAGVVQLLKIV